MTQENPLIEKEISIESIRLTQNFAEDLAVKRKLTVVPVTKPHSAWWVRVHPENSYQVETMCVQDSEDRTFYLIHPTLHQKLSDEGRTFRLHTAMNRQGNVFLWPVKQPTPEVEQRMDHYYRSVWEAISLAKKEWIRIKWNQGLGAYDLLRTERKVLEPQWPEEPFQEIVNIAFQNQIISSMDHPLVTRLLYGT